ncbi:MAG: hypothetical protein NTV54_09675 [Ignavibacteriales bacterium]|nr:hypothetical protein [Ignavibacteriales bacterium]
MPKKNTSLLDEQETPFIVPGHRGIDWKATKGNFIHLAKAAFYFTVSQCDKYILNDDMRDPDAVIVESLRDNIQPVLIVLQYCEKQGMSKSTSKVIRTCDWLKMTKEDVIRALCPEAKAMRIRKIRLRTHREERKKNGSAVSVE